MITRAIFLFLCCTAVVHAATAAQRERALKATQAMQPMTHLSKHDLYRIALFIESRLPREVARGKHYFPIDQTKLAAPIQYLRATKRVAINFSNVIGEGFWKTAKGAILYDPVHPQRLVRGVQSNDIGKEAKTTLALSGKPGLIEAYGASHYDDHGSKYALYTKRYNGGSLEDARESGREFTPLQQIAIAYDLARGLNSLHSHGYIHRDLGLRNYFYNKQKGRVTAAIADYGRTCKYRDAKGVRPQGNDFYFAPECLRWKRMRTAEYKAAEVYTLGCIFYRLLHDWDMGDWQQRSIIRGSPASASARQQRLASKIRKVTAPRLCDLKQKRKLTPMQQLERLTLQMVQPNPHKRGTAATVMKRVEAIAVQAGVIKPPQPQSQPQQSRAAMKAHNAFKHLWKIAENPG